LARGHFYLLTNCFSDLLSKELTAGIELPEARGQLVPKVNSYQVDLKNSYLVVYYTL